MTRLHSGTVSQPRYQSRPYRPRPARREFIHGRIQPLADTRREPLWWKALKVGVMGCCAIYALKLAVIG